MVESVSKRLNGWKAIAGHFKRDRTTVMRWSQTRALPLYRVPGSGSSSVYAFSHELDEWLAKTEQGDETVKIVERIEAEPIEVTLSADIVEEKSPALKAAPNPPPRRAVIAALASVGVIALGGGIVWRAYSKDKAKDELPNDTKLAQIYLQAKSDWAARTPAGLHRAIEGFVAVTARDPRFAPGFSALADAYLLVREFDGTPDALAYPRAEAAAKSALALDQNMSEAHRAMGFINYWWHRHIPAARTAFSRAVVLDNASAQTHFWYGNALVDNGQAQVGLRELDQARLIEPGSKLIQVDYIWAQWSDGQFELAKQKLTQLAAAGDNASLFTYLAYIGLAQRDWRGYLNANARRGALREDTVLIARAAKEQAAFDRGGETGLLAFMNQSVVTDLSVASPDTSWAAALAALAGDKTKLLAIATVADRRREVWGFSGFTGPVFARWQSDPQIGPLLKRRRGPSLLMG
jgi:hypothetical protein